MHISRRGAFRGIGRSGWTVLIAAAWLAGAARAQTPGVWVAGDFHNHSRLTDGSHHPRTVIDKGLKEFGLDWMANSEHGGAFGRDPEARYWEDPSIQPPVKILGDEIRDSKKRRLMWRWQSLTDYSFPIIAQARRSPQLSGKVVLQGLEFNCPAHDHVSVGILTDNALPIAEFEYRFDANDTDTSGGPDGAWKGKNNKNDHAKALQAIAWLDAHFGGRSWFVANHPERAGKVRVEDLRDFNNTAGKVAFGFEGAPGHQKHKNRGGYSDNSYKYADNGMGGSTYGGVGVFVARVGGVWDALLGEGRTFFIYANSDFHDVGNDFYPGEYQKTYVKVAGPLTEQSILDGLRAGRSFFVSGDLVDAVEIEASAGKRAAGMGEALRIDRGSDVQVTMRLHDPAGKNCLGDEVDLRGMDLIGGEVGGPVSKYLEDGRTPNPAYASELNPSTRILAHFDSSTWKLEGDGWISATYTIRAVDRNMYVRLRGTNHLPSTEGETDAQSNPLSDILTEKLGRNGLEEARADLWFYANPVFIRVD